MTAVQHAPDALDEMLDPRITSSPAWCAPMPSPEHVMVAPGERRVIRRASHDARQLDWSRPLVQFANAPLLLVDFSRFHYPLVPLEQVWPDGFVLSLDRVWGGWHQEYVATHRQRDDLYQQWCAEDREAQRVLLARIAAELARPDADLWEQYGNYSCWSGPAVYRWRLAYRMEIVRYHPVGQRVWYQRADQQRHHPRELM